MNPAGERLHVDDTGAGEPYVLLHSSGLSGRQWRRLSAELVARGRRVLAVDLSGHGRSPAWPDEAPFSFRIDVDRIVAILREACGAHVIGHSYGGFLALHVALAAPELVRSLAVFDPVAFGVLAPARDADAIAILHALDLSWGPDAADHERWLRTFVDFWSGPGAWDALREDARAEFRRVGWVCEEGVRTLLADHTPPATFARLAMPVRIVNGELSPLPARRVGERLAEAIPGATRTIVGGVGHMGPLADPAATNRALLGDAP